MDDMMHAAEAGDAAALDDILRHYESNRFDVNSRDAMGYTALHYACSSGRAEVRTRGAGERENEGERGRRREKRTKRERKREREKDEDNSERKDRRRILFLPNVQRKGENQKRE